MNVRIRRFCTAVCFAAILVSIFSCGRKTDPLTPDSPRPAAVQITGAVTRDHTTFLSWSLPTRNVEGKTFPPEQIESFFLYRADVVPEKKRLRYRQVAVIEMPNPANAEVTGGVVHWKDDNLDYGQVYAYRVRAESRQGGVSPNSEEVRVAPLLTVSPPKNVRAVAGDSKVAITWDAVTTRADGSRHEGFIGYNIYRGAASHRYKDKPVNDKPLRTNSFADKDVVNGRTYFYIIRAVDSPVLPWRESLDSLEVSATPRDMTPPRSPAGLTVVPGVGRIFLTWNENRESDVAGYIVYRSTKSRKEFERLTAAPIKRTTFSDEAVKPGTMYYYKVAAVDGAGNESAPSKELAATAENVR